MAEADAYMGFLAFAPALGVTASLFNVCTAGNPLQELRKITEYSVLELLTAYISVGVLPAGFPVWDFVTTIETIDGGNAEISLILYLQAVVNAVAIFSWVCSGYFSVLFQLLFLGNASSRLQSLLRESK